MHTALPKTIFPNLTDREREILKLIAQGDTNSQIANKLTLSQKTISNYVSNIYSKLQVVDRAQAIIRARKARNVMDSIKVSPRNGIDAKRWLTGGSP